METIELCKCCNCKDIITDPESGVIVHGNVYHADPKKEVALNYSAFPPESSSKFTQDAVERIAYCQGCFLKLVFPKLKITNTRGFFNDVNK